MPMDLEIDQDINGNYYVNIRCESRDVAKDILEQFDRTALIAKAFEKNISGKESVLSDTERLLEFLRLAECHYRMVIVSKNAPKLP